MNEFESKIKEQLIIRGFSEKQIINNRGLIGAVIDETILRTVKNLELTAVGCQREQLIAFCKWYNEVIPSYESTEEDIVTTYLSESN